MFKSSILLIFTLFVVISLNSQDLPKSWQISPEERMLTIGGDNDNGFYAQNQLQDIELEFVQPNWWELLEGNYDSATDLMANCWINGIRYDSVGVRFKGATSYFRNDTEKKSFNITLDYMIVGQDIEGYNTFNLNCGWEDNSSMKEVLYNNIGLHYAMGLKSNFANLTINGVNWGPYQNVQQFDSDYIKEWYLSNDGTIFRAERTDFIPGQGGMGGPNFGAGESSLNYNGPDSTHYNMDYTIKRTEVEDPWAGLIDACIVLNNEPLESLEEELSKVLDIDKACWFLAHEVIFSDDDSYINKGGMDYYLYYEAETGRIIPMEYDGNSVLADDKLSWDLFYNEDNTDFPLLNRMLAVPSIRQRYLAHVRLILQEYFNPLYIDAKIDFWEELIDELVQEDPKKFYSYSQFLSSITSLKEDVATRRNFLLNNAELSGGVPLTIDQVSYIVEGVQWQTPTENNQVEVVANVSGSSGVASVYLYYGEGLTGVFEKIIMYDDGQHNDGAAKDGQYGGVIPSKSIGTYVRFYIEAIAADNAATASFEPKGAEHNVFLYQVGIEPASESTIVINELMAENNTAVEDEFGEYDDWLELYNLGDTDVNLSGWILTDNINDLEKFEFQEGTIIESGAYLVIWADEDEDQGELHSNFKLSANGESLYLLNDMQELVDEISFPKATEDLSYARSPNGTGLFLNKDHTLGLNNDLMSHLYETKNEIKFSVYPNPASEYIIISNDNEIYSPYSFTLFNVEGQLLHAKNNTSNNQTINVADYLPGLYFIDLQVGGKSVMYKFIKM